MDKIFETLASSSLSIRRNVRELNLFFESTNQLIKFATSFVFEKEKPEILKLNKSIDFYVKLKSIVK